MASLPHAPLGLGLSPDGNEGRTGDAVLARTSYRVGGRSPSPARDSDSDGALRHKAKYFELALWVGRRWYAVAHFGRRRAAREVRVVACLTTLRLTGFVELVARRVLSFLPPVAGVLGRRLPRYNRHGILISPRASEGSGERIPWDPWGDSS